MLHKHEIYFSEKSEKLEKEDIDILYDVHNLILKSDTILNKYEEFISERVFDNDDFILKDEKLIKTAVIDLVDVIYGIISEIENDKKENKEEEKNKNLNLNKIKNEDLNLKISIKDEDEKKIENEDLKSNKETNKKKNKYKHNLLLDGEISSDD